MSATPTDYESIFMFPEGQRVLEDLMERFAKAPFVAGQPDQTAFNCGTKAVIEHIWAQIAAAKGA
ncbi:hypothetical protein CDN99_06615 [Roseateles aquatilis]|uniref:Bbp19-like phage domain-containing protein n=1 Tax=Roseateles aquatilis TaxID=431061 RepID=A0A246JHI2_9BURK|nr:hypothetical protein [Roseateles aquatilis]OWQ92025.1 hypothetical protein CDN99_06615 [Roseateles aquatilis]